MTPLLRARPLTPSAQTTCSCPRACAVLPAMSSIVHAVHACRAWRCTSPCVAQGRTSVVPIRTPRAEAVAGLHVSCRGPRRPSACALVHAPSFQPCRLSYTLCLLRVALHVVLRRARSCVWCLDSHAVASLPPFCGRRIAAPAPFCIVHHSHVRVLSLARPLSSERSGIPRVRSTRRWTASLPANRLVAAKPRGCRSGQHTAVSPFQHHFAARASVSVLFCMSCVTATCAFCRSHRHPLLQTLQRFPSSPALSRVCPCAQSPYLLASLVPYTLSVSVFSVRVSLTIIADADVR